MDKGKNPLPGLGDSLLAPLFKAYLKWGGKRVGGCWSEGGATNWMDRKVEKDVLRKTPVPRFISIQEFVSCGRYYGQDLSPQQVNYVHYIQYIDRHLSMFYLVFSQPLLCFQMPVWLLLSHWNRPHLNILILRILNKLFSAAWCLQQIPWRPELFKCEATGKLVCRDKT